MTEKQLIMHIVFKYIMFALFMFFLIDTITSFGWGFFAIVFALIATNDFVQGTRLMQLYFQFKKNKKK